MKVNYLSARGMSSNQEPGNLSWAPAHQTTQNGILTKSGLLKSGNLMKCWKQERGDPWVGNQQVRSPNTQTSLSLMTIMWTCDTATKSDLSLKARSFLHRVNDRLRKILDHSSKDAMQDIDKHSLIWGLFMSSTLEASVFMGKSYSENLHSIKKYREQSHFETDV